MRIFRTSIFKVLLVLLVIIGSALIAIILHAIFPAKVDESLFDSLLVIKYGFPFVAVLYFIILFSHCTLILFINRNALINTKRRSQINFALSFALMYMIGMQEIIFGSNPYSQWGIQYIIYQIWMGIGDALPVILLCLIVGAQFFQEKIEQETNKKSIERLTLLIFVVVIGTIRLLFSLIGIIKSSILDYPIPVAIWGYILGLIFGIIYLMIQNTTKYKLETMGFGIGINWIIFNSFIGMIQKNAMFDSILRSLIDIASLFISIFLTTIIQSKFLEGNRPRPPGSGDIGGRSRKISDITFAISYAAPRWARLGFRRARSRASTRLCAPRESSQKPPIRSSGRA